MHKIKTILDNSIIAIVAFMLGIHSIVGNEIMPMIIAILMWVMLLLCVFVRKDNDYT